MCIDEKKFLKSIFEPKYFTIFQSKKLKTTHPWSKYKNWLTITFNFLDTNILSIKAPHYTYIYTFQDNTLQDGDFKCVIKLSISIDYPQSSEVIYRACESQIMSSNLHKVLLHAYLIKFFLKYNILSKIAHIFASLAYTLLIHHAIYHNQVVFC